MIHTYVLHDILKCMNREGLTKMQETTRAINDLIKRDFASKPLLFLSAILKLAIKEDNSVTALICTYHHNNNDSYEFLVPSTGQWLYNRERSFYPFKEVCPFLPSYIRIRRVEINLGQRQDTFDQISGSVPNIRMEEIATLESISHIWSGQMLDINDHWSGVNSRSTDLLYKNPVIYTCRSLRIDAGEQRLPRELIGNPLFYTLPKVGFWWQTAQQEIMEIVQLKTAFPQSDTMIAVGTKDGEIGPVVEQIREEFLAATEPCLLHMSIGFNEYELDQFDIPGSLRIENARTKEVLQWKIVDEDGPERNYDVYFDGHLCINIQRFCA